MNPSNRSPCPATTLRESAQPSLLRDDHPAEPPAQILTPERAASRGLAVPGQVTEGMALHEEAPFLGGIQLKEEKRGRDTVTTVKLDVAYADIINRNGRYYPRSCYEAANARADLDGGLWSLMDHPEWWEPLKGSLDKVCVKIEELGIDDREVEWPVGSGQTRTLPVVTARGIIVETVKGLDARALLKSGIKVGVSTNGWGSSKWVRAGDLDPNYYDPEELIPVTQDDFTYFSIDLVSDPSNLGGRARTERRAATPPAQEATPPSVAASAHVPKEGSMHPLLKALLEKYAGKTIDQIKTEHHAEYIEVLEKINSERQTEQVQAPAPAGPVPAPAPAAAPAPAELPSVDYSAATVSMAHYRALESRVVQLTNRNGELETQIRNMTRDTIALTALEAARLPSSGSFEDGGVTIDLDASFRQDLIDTSRAARTDEAAREAVSRKITERRAVLGKRQAEDPTAGRQQHEHLDRTRNPGPALPGALTESQQRPGDETYAPLREAFSELI